MYGITDVVRACWMVINKEKVNDDGVLRGTICSTDTSEQSYRINMAALHSTDRVGEGVE